jgi:hypothetical protein
VELKSKGDRHMRFAMVINVYVDVDENKYNSFDHPTSFERFNEENTLIETVKSINKLGIDKEDNLRVYIFAVATQKETKYDSEIRKKIRKIFEDEKCPYETLIYTNDDIFKLKEITNNDFLDTSGYPEIRNLGLIIPSILKEDVIIQIDDDELLREQYILHAKQLIKFNGDKYIITAPYEKNGTIRIKASDPLTSWKKFSTMDNDMERLINYEGLRETLFGFGGNMIIKRETAQVSFYPLDVPRGEDFSYLLANRLIYENGNDEVGILHKDNRYAAYFCCDKEVTIIHRPPREAKKDFLKYFENNMRRFIMEWNMFSNQQNLSESRLEELSYYLKAMFGYKDMKKKLLSIVEEIRQKYDYPKEKVDEVENTLICEIEKYINKDRWQEYKDLQKSYIYNMEKMGENKYVLLKALELGGK